MNNEQQPIKCPYCGAGVHCQFLGNVITDMFCSHCGDIEITAYMLAKKEAQPTAEKRK